MGYKNCIEHIGRRTPKGLITCTECGHTWQSENGELTDNLLGCECPHCHTTLKVETTLRRKFNDYEYLCIVTRCKGFKYCASSISSVGRKWDRHPFTPISKPYSGGLPRRTLRNLRTAAPDGLLRSRVELVERIGTAGGERREIQHHAHTHLSPATAYPRTAPKRLRQTTPRCNPFRPYPPAALGEQGRNAA